MSQAKPIRLAYCISGIYRAGGLERIIAVKMNHLVAMGYEVHLITSSQGGREFYYPIDERIKHTDLNSQPGGKDRGSLLASLEDVL